MTLSDTLTNIITSSLSSLRQVSSHQATRNSGWKPSGPLGPGTHLLPVCQGAWAGLLSNTTDGAEVGLEIVSNQMIMIYILAPSHANQQLLAGLGRALGMSIIVFILLTEQCNNTVFSPRADYCKNVCFTFSAKLLYVRALTF